MIIAFEGQPVTDGNTLRNRIASIAPGTQVKLTLWRDQRSVDVQLTLGEYEARKRTG